MGLQERKVIVLLMGLNWVLDARGLVSKRTELASLEGRRCCKEKNKVAELKRQTAYFEVFSRTLTEQASLPMETFQMFLPGYCR